MADLLLANARVYRHEGDTDLPAVADVAIRDGLIAEIGPDLPREGFDVLDLAGHVLVPGFVNGHYHSHDVLAKGLFEAVSLERWGLIAGAIGSNRSPAEVYLRTLLGAVECVRNGITTVQDFAALSPLNPETLDAVVSAYQRVGIRVILGVVVRDRSQLETILWADELVAREHWDIVGTGRDDGLAQVASIEREMARVGDRDGLVVWAVAPSAPQRCSPELLQRVAGFTADADLPVYTHVYETRLQRHLAHERFGAHGGSIVRYMEANGLLTERVTMAHGVWPDGEEIQRVAGAGTGVVLNMLSNLRLRSGVAPLDAYRRLGIPLSLGCDNCSCSDVQSMLQVMKLYCLMGGISDPMIAPPTAPEAIRIATQGGAKAARIADRTGAIEPGMSADILAYDLADPAWRPLNSVARQLVHAETGRGLRHVWIAGRHVVANQKCLTVDEDVLMRDIDALMPVVRADLDRLATKADLVDDAFRAIQKRAFAKPLSYTRHLAAS